MILHNENIALPASGEITAVGIENKSYANLFDEDNNIYFVPQKLPIPLNVFVIGTVNVDETTYMFSPKVLDRSNVMEFNHVDLYHAYHYGEVEPHQIVELPGVSALPFDLRIKLATSKDTQDFTTLYPTEFRVLVDIFKVLAEQNLHFGYRVFNEISRFVLNFCGNQAGAEEVLAALDIQILQKVLPKLNGSDDEIGDTLKKLMEISGNHNLLRTVRKISRMSDSLTRLGYATYIE